MTFSDYVPLIKSGKDQFHSIANFIDKRLVVAKSKNNSSIAKFPCPFPFFVQSILRASHLLIGQFESNDSSSSSVSFVNNSSVSSSNSEFITIEIDSDSEGFDTRTDRDGGSFTIFEIKDSTTVSYRYRGTNL